MLTAMKSAKFERFFMVDVARKSQTEADPRPKGEVLPPVIQFYQQ